MKIFKKIFSTLTAVCLCCCCSINGYCENNEKELESMLVLGDSIASGYGLEGYVPGKSYSDDSYGVMLKKEYGLSDEGYNNFAIDGQTSEELFQKLESGTYDSYLDNDIIIISIGGNDLLDVIIGENSPIYQEPEIMRFLNGEITLMQAMQNVNMVKLSSEISSLASEKTKLFGESLPKIIKSIKDRNPDAVIVVQNLYNPMNTGVQIIDSLYESTISKLNDEIEKAEGIIICDVFSAFSEASDNLIQSDFTHPNAKGHKVIFNQLKNVIENQCGFTACSSSASTIPETSAKDSIFAFLLTASISLMVITSKSKKHK